mmetsp:Transcript_64091/g.150214  ORF Transcript_64091/g.150214 Transcript_64091/m.150214 type:complete len:213 (-) Transcript_64091:2237-2875(-)
METLTYCCRRRETALSETACGKELTRVSTTSSARGIMPAPETPRASSRAASFRSRASAFLAFKVSHHDGAATCGTLIRMPLLTRSAHLVPSTCQDPSTNLASCSPGSSIDCTRSCRLRTAATASARSWSVRSPKRSRVALAGFCMTTSSSGHRTPSKTRRSRLPRLPWTFVGTGPTAAERTPGSSSRLTQAPSEMRGSRVFGFCCAALRQHC